MTGHFYKRHLNLSDQAAASVRQALHQAAPHIVFGYTPDNQLVSKKRHLKQIEDNLSQLTRALLPNAAVSYSDVTKAWWISRHGGTVPPLIIM